MEGIERYTVQAEAVPTKPGCWNKLQVSIFEGDQKIGEYERNYSTLINTFCPFIGVDGREYALYSPKYTATRVMELPSCRDLGGEDEALAGFCPTGYYVPRSANLDSEYIGPAGQFGFVCGCYWGDDNSWKIQFLDLTRVAEGVIKRDDRFGYVELKGSASDLSKAIEVEDFDQEDFDNGDIYVWITCTKQFRLGNQPNQE